MTADWVPGESVLDIIDSGFQDLPLFDTPGPLVNRPQPLPGSKDSRRTARQAADIEARRNPLTRGPAHPDAPAVVSRWDGYRRPGTCGDCKYLLSMAAGNKSFKKCGFVSADLPPDPTGPRITGGVGSDVRCWWLACSDYRPGP